MVEPQRTCCACRRTGARDELLRFVCGPDRRVTLDLRGKLPGRGAYLCPRARCLAKGSGSKGLARALDCQPPASSAEELWRQALGGLERLLKEGIGHANRAGGLVWGADRVAVALEEGQADWVLVAGDAGESTCKDMRIRLGEEGVVPVLTKAELGGLIDRGDVAVAAITHPKLGRKIYALAARWNRLREEKVNGQG